MKDKINFYELWSNGLAHKMIYSRVTGNPVFFVREVNEIDLRRRGSYFYNGILFEQNSNGTIRDIECTLTDGNVVSLTQLHEAYKIMSLCNSGFMPFAKFMQERLKDKTDIRELGFNSDEISKVQKATAEIICIGSQLWGQGKLNPNLLEFEKPFSSQAEFDTYIKELNDERNYECDEEYEEDDNEETTVK